MNTRRSAIKSWLASITTFTFFISNVVGLHAAESSMWVERRQMLLSAGQGPSWRGLPAPLKGLSDGLPGSISPSADGRWAGLVPPSCLPRCAELLRAVSPAHGRVRRVSLPSSAPSGKIIIFLQDVHKNDEAQRNLGAMVSSLASSGRVAFVGLEAAFAPLDLERFRSFEDQDALRAAADYLLREHQISGPVHAAYTHPGAIPPFIGVDDPARYRANVEAYRRAAPAADEARYRLAVLARRLAREKEKAFGPALWEFDRKVSEYHEGRSAFGEYVEALAEAVPPAEQSRLFLRALRMEEAIDFPRVEEERARLVEAVVRVLPKERVDRLLQASLAYRGGELSHADYYRAVRDLCRDGGVDLAAYPAMDAYVGYVLLADRIDADRLFREVVLSEAAAYGKLASTPEEKRLAAESRRLALAAKLLDFSLTPDEWEEYRASGAGKATEAEGFDLSPFESFYREAEARDQAMADNVMRALGETLSLPGGRGAGGDGVAVLVAGGFHADGVTRLLTRRGATVIEMAPALTKAVDGVSTALGVFARERTPLEQLFKGDRLFLGDKPDRPGALAAVTVAVVAVKSGTEKAKESLTRLADGVRLFFLRVKGGRVEEVLKTAEGRVEMTVTVRDGAVVDVHPLLKAGFWAVAAAAAVAGTALYTHVATGTVAAGHLATVGVFYNLNYFLLPWLIAAAGVAGVLAAAFIRGDRRRNAISTAAIFLLLAASGCSKTGLLVDRFHAAPESSAMEDGGRAETDAAVPPVPEPTMEGGGRTGAAGMEGQQAGAPGVAGEAGSFGEAGAGVAGSMEGAAGTIGTGGTGADGGASIGGAAGTAGTAPDSKLPPPGPDGWTVISGPDRTIIVMFKEPNALLLYDSNGNSLLYKEVDDGAITDVKFSPDGRYVAVLFYYPANSAGFPERRILEVFDLTGNTVHTTQNYHLNNGFASPVVFPDYPGEQFVLSGFFIESFTITNAGVTVTGYPIYSVQRMGVYVTKGDPSQRKTIQKDFAMPALPDAGTMGSLTPAPVLRRLAAAAAGLAVFFLASPAMADDGAAVLGASLGIGSLLAGLAGAVAAVVLGRLALRRLRFDVNKADREEWDSFLRGVEPDGKQRAKMVDTLLKARLRKPFEKIEDLSVKGIGKKRMDLIRRRAWRLSFPGQRPFRRPTRRDIGLGGLGTVVGIVAWLVFSQRPAAHEEVLGEVWTGPGGAVSLTVSPGDRNILRREFNEASETESGELLRQTGALLRGRGIDLSPLEGKTIRVRFLGPSARDHEVDGNVGLDDKARDVARRYPQVGRVVLVVSLAHGLAHEAGLTEEEMTTPGALLREATVLARLMSQMRVDPRQFQEVASALLGETSSPGAAPAGPRPPSGWRSEESFSPGDAERAKDALERSRRTFRSWADETLAKTDKKVLVFGEFHMSVSHKRLFRTLIIPVLEDLKAGYLVTEVFPPEMQPDLDLFNKAGVWTPPLDKFLSLLGLGSPQLEAETRALFEDAQRAGLKIKAGGPDFALVLKRSRAPRSEAVKGVIQTGREIALNTRAAIAEIRRKNPAAVIAVYVGRSHVQRSSEVTVYEGPDALSVDFLSPKNLSSSPVPVPFHDRQVRHSRLFIEAASRMGIKDSNVAGQPLDQSFADWVLFEGDPERIMAGDLDGDKPSKETGSRSKTPGGVLPSLLLFLGSGAAAMLYGGGAKAQSLETATAAASSGAPWGLMLGIIVVAGLVAFAIVKAKPFLKGFAAKAMDRLGRWRRLASGRVMALSLAVALSGPAAGADLSLDLMHANGRAVDALSVLRSASQHSAWYDLHPGFRADFREAFQRAVGRGEAPPVRESGAPRAEATRLVEKAAGAVQAEALPARAGESFMAWAVVGGPGQLKAFKERVLSAHAGGTGEVLVMAHPSVSQGDVERALAAAGVRAALDFQASAEVPREGDGREVSEAAFVRAAEMWLPRAGARLKASPGRVSVYAAYPGDMNLVFDAALGAEVARWAPERIRFALRGFLGRLPYMDLDGLADVVLLVARMA